jgi:hypothetical protein
MEIKMTSLISAMKNISYTNNGAITYSTSTNALVDFFFTSGTMRFKPEEEIIEVWNAAFNGNPQAALRLLFYARDVRGGQGERRVARQIFTSMVNNNDQESALAENLHLIPEYGRWDDLLLFMNTSFEEPALGLITNALAEENSLCSKWMPSESSTKDYNGVKGYVAARKIREFMCISKRAYRKMRSRLNNVVESQMCAKEWDEIEFAKIPSQCALKSKEAFHKNCKERYEQYVGDLANGTEKVNATTLHPHQLVQEIRNDHSDYQGIERPLIAAQWASLPNYFENHTKTKFLPLVDVSGSMTQGKGNIIPLDVAIGLGCYIAERNVGPFQNAFLTFSNEPSLEFVNGEDIWEKVHNLSGADWGGNTNLIAAFDLILHHAVHSNIAFEEMPEKVLILSDMEFDESQREDWGGNPIPKLNLTAYEEIQRKFKVAGYNAPQIVFWNLGASNNNVPVKAHESGAALISGFSPSILKQLLETGNVSSVELMLQVINSDRYASITI